MNAKPWPLCLNTSTIRPASLLDKLAIAAESGYSAIELWNDDLTQFEQEGGSLHEIKSRVQDLGLTVPSVIALFDWMQSEGESKKTALVEARRRMAQAEAVGARYIVASPVPDNQNVDISQAAARYHELLELGEQVGVLPAMEFLGFFRNVYQLEQAIAIARQADHSGACIVLDPFHLYRGGSGFGGLTAIGNLKISICHFNDSPSSPPQFEQGDGDRVYPGDGILPLTQMLHDLATIGYDGYLSVELFNAAYWQQDLRQVARTAREKTETIRDTVIRSSQK